MKPPVHYFPFLKGTFEATAVSNVYIVYSDEKRMIIRSPVSDPTGNIFSVSIAVEGYNDTTKSTKWSDFPSRF